MILDVAWLWAGVGIAMYAVGVNVVLILPGDNPVPIPVFAAALVGAFTVFFAGFILFRRSLPQRYVRPQQRPTTATWPRFVDSSLLLALAAIVAVFVLNIATFTGPIPPGQPEQVGPTQFVSNSHGVMTPITYQEYLQYLEDGQRMFVGGSLLFYFLGTLMLAAWVDHVRLRRVQPNVGRPILGSDADAGS